MGDRVLIVRGKAERTIPASPNEQPFRLALPSSTGPGLRDRNKPEHHNPDREGTA